MHSRKGLLPLQVFLLSVLYGQFCFICLALSCLFFIFDAVHRALVLLFSYLLYYDKID